MGDEKREVSWKSNRRSNPRKLLEAGIGLRGFPRPLVIRKLAAIADRFQVARASLLTRREGLFYGKGLRTFGGVAVLFGLYKASFEESMLQFRASTRRKRGRG
jgi:hypothetical protein